jgi:prepilin-type N-terminal cleavage/methylation domain-containing protein
MLKLYENEKGLTLIEVLASIVLLSVVIMSFLSLFPQITNFNKYTEENLQAAATAKELRVLVKEKFDNFESPTSTNVLVNETMDISSDSIKFIGQFNDFPVEVVIFKDKKDVSGSFEDLYQMKISILNENNNEISYTYGYISNKK